MRWAMRSVSSPRKTRDHCVHSSVSSAAGSFGKRRKASITNKLRPPAMSAAGEQREAGSPRSNRDYREILRMEAAILRAVRSDGASEMLHRTIVRRADLIEGIAEAIGVRDGFQTNSVFQQS